MLHGKATAVDTKRFIETHTKFQPNSYRKLGDIECFASAIGFGCYRIDAEVPHHAEALKKALKSGCNLIDTSSNYTDGASEFCVGRVLKQLAESGELSREQVIVVSKVGYVQGQNLELAREAETSGNAFPEMVKYMDGCWHCIHPSFLENQIDRSLHRLDLETIDVYLLHNPEYFLSDAKKRRDTKDLKALRTEFYRRIEAAFVCLEGMVSAGKIANYGVSSNSFVDPHDDIEATSVSEMWKIAEKIGQERLGGADKHHFRVIQFPANLLETGFVLEKNNGDQLNETVLEFATRKNLACLINRPLNAITHNELTRLAEFPAPEGEFDLNESLKEMKRLEVHFVQEVGPSLKLHAQNKVEDFFTWGHQLAKIDFTHFSADRWKNLRSEAITPQILYLMEQLERYAVLNQSESWDEWKESYSTALNKTLDAISQSTSRESQEKSEALKRELTAISNSLSKMTLSQQAMFCLAQTPGVTSVLNGMREAKYVDDSLGVMGIPSQPFELPLWQEISRRLH